MESVKIIMTIWKYYRQPSLLEVINKKGEFFNSLGDWTADWKNSLSEIQLLHFENPRSFPRKLGKLNL